MQDNDRLDGPVLSVPQDAQAPKLNWSRSIENDTEAYKFQSVFNDRLIPWLDMGDKLMTQINYAMMSMSAMSKNKSEKTNILLERVRPIIALKEVIDLEVMRRSVDILERLERKKL